MKSWYSTKDGASLQHKSQPIVNGKRIFLTEAQAALHGDKVEKSDPPQSADEAGVKTEFEEWQRSQSAAEKGKPKEKSSKEQGASSK